MGACQSGDAVTAEDPKPVVVAPEPVEEPQEKQRAIYAP